MMVLRSARSDSWLAAIFSLFAVSSTFSIALSQISLGLALVLFIAMMAARRQNPFGGVLAPLYIAIGCYVLWNFISPLASSTPLKSFLMAREEWLFAVLPIGIHVMTQERHRRWVLAALAVGVIVLSVYGSIQYFTGLHWPRSTPPTPQIGGGFFPEGTFAHHLTYGNYFAVVSTFLLGWVLLFRMERWDRLQKLGAAAAAAGVIATVMSLARTATAALPVAIMLAAGLRARRWFVRSLGAVAVVSVATLVLVPSIAGRYRLALQKDFAGTGEAARTHIWGKSLAMTLEHPMFGVGHGHFPEEYARLNDSALGESRVFPHAHNDLLTVTTGTGLPGGVLFLAMWGVVGWFLVRSYRQGKTGSWERALSGGAIVGSVVFLLCSVTEATFFDEEVRTGLLLVWAAGLWPYRMIPAGPILYKDDRARMSKSLTREEENR